MENIVFEDNSAAQAQPAESQWCLVGNIVEQRSYGEGHQMRPGTKHFSGGTKVYCLPGQWGDGFEQIIVIGRHRGSKQFKTMVISSDWVTNWRAKVVYNPEVLRRIKMATKCGNWQSQDQVDEYVKEMAARHAKRDVRAEIYPIENVPFGRLTIMPRPRAGDWLQDEVASWRRARINWVVSLLESAEIAELGLEQEAEACRREGIGFLTFPIPDRGVPDSAAEFAVLVESLVSKLRAGCGVAIHCRIGIGRSSLVAACVLASLGQPIEMAWQSIEEARGQLVPDTPEQRAWVASFIERGEAGKL